MLAVPTTVRPGTWERPRNRPSMVAWWSSTINTFASAVSGRSVFWVLGIADKCSWGLLTSPIYPLYSFNIELLPNLGQELPALMPVVQNIATAMGAKS